MNRKLTLEQEQQIVSMYVADGKSSSEIAPMFGVSDGTVLLTLHRNGIPTRNSHKGRRLELTSEQTQFMLERYAAGDSGEVIATALGVSGSLVWQRLREAGAEMRPAGFGHGAQHHGWVGGRRVTEDGYVLVWLPYGHPFLSMAQEHGSAEGGYVLEHRLVMAQHLGRPLREDETVHHKNNRDRQNNALDNLQLRIGRHGKGASFRCADCGSCNIEPVPILDGPEVS